MICRTSPAWWNVGLIFCSLLFPARFAAASSDKSPHTIRNEPQIAVTNTLDKNNCSVAAAESLFDSGNFSSADRLVDLCLSQQPLPASVELTKVYQLKARLAFAFKKEMEMETWLRKAADVDPSAKMSQLRDPPQLYAMWTRISAEAKFSREKSAENVQQQQPASEFVESSSSPGRDTVNNNQMPAAEKTLPAPTSANTSPKFKETFISVESGIKSKVKFGMGLLPFGIGHIAHSQIWEGSTFLVSESALVLLTSGLADSSNQRIRDADRFSSSSSSISFETESRWADQATAYSLLGLTGFGALWGFEILHLLPTLARENPEQVPWVRFALSLAPMGVAQLKNGERSKALGLAGTQSFFLLLSGALPNSGQRSVSFVMFAGSLVFGAVDGWINHDWNVDPASPPAWSFGILPIPIGKESRLPLLVTFKYAIQQ